MISRMPHAIRNVDRALIGEVCVEFSVRKRADTPAEIAAYSLEFPDVLVIFVT